MFDELMKLSSESYNYNKSITKNMRFAFTAYKGSEYIKINNYLRDQSIITFINDSDIYSNSTMSVMGAIISMDEYFSNCPVLEENIMVYRGMSNIPQSIIDTWKVGNSFNYPNYMSTTVNFPKIFNFMNDDNSFIWVIIVPAGTPYVYLDRLLSIGIHTQIDEFNKNLQGNMMNVYEKFVEICPTQPLTFKANLFADNYINCNSNITDWMYNRIGEAEILLPRGLTCTVMAVDKLDICKLIPNSISPVNVITIQVTL